MSFIERVRARAAGRPARIVFPESADERTLAAVREMARGAIVTPVLVLDPERPATHGAACDTGAEVLDPATANACAAVARHLLERRAAKGLTSVDAERLAGTPLYFADGLVALGLADGCVAGAANTTADVLRAAIWSVGAAVGSTTVSSAFYMVVPDFRGGGEEVLTFTDCAVVPTPTAKQLADIALAAADDRRRIVGDEPRVALLSYSTRGSGGAGGSVVTVQAALTLIRDRAPALCVDGELQADAALLPAVARRKVGEHTGERAVAGRANVLVFPSLDAGNIAYKLVERLAHAQAVGPIIQGLARPCSDLSRGASIDDIINVSAITALQATDATGRTEDPEGD